MGLLTICGGNSFEEMSKCVYLAILNFCPSLLSLSVATTMIKATYFSSQFEQPFITQGSKERNSRQLLEGRNCDRDQGRTLLTYRLASSGYGSYLSAAHAHTVHSGLEPDISVSN